MRLKKAKHQLSLLNQAILLITLCWLIPMGGVILIINYYSNDVITEQVNFTNKIEMEESARIVEVMLSQGFEAIKQPALDKILLDAYEESNDGENVSHLYQETMNYLAKNYSYNSLIHTTIISYHNEESLNYHMNCNRATSDNSIGTNEGEQIIKILKKRKDEIDTSTILFVLNHELYLARNLIRGSFEPYATIVMKLNKENIFQSMLSYTYLEMIHIEIDGLLPGFGGSYLDIYIDENSKFQEYENEPIVINSNIEGNLLHYKVYKDKDELMNGINEMQSLLIQLIICLIPIVFGVILLFYENFVSPIHYLVAAMRRVSKGELGHQMTHVYSGAEFIYLKDKFNEMSLGMKEQFEYQYEEQLALRDAQIRALQSQINPHFMNNTLEVINWEIRLGENEKASMMLESFSTMMNAAMSRSGQSLISLKEELSYMDAYLYIVSVRMGKKLTIKKNIDETLYDVNVPRLMLQPIVENAIEHGISFRSEGTLSISVYKEKDNIMFDIINDKELDENDVEKIQMILECNNEKDLIKIGHTNLGLRNVNQRLKLIYGVRYSLSIDVNEKGHTLARVTIPIEYEKEN